MSTTLPDSQIMKRMGRSSILGLKIAGTGIGIPEKPVTNADLQSLGFDADWILQRTGIESRFHAPEEVSTSDLATDAARNCLKAANVDASAVDLIIVATMTPDHFTPSTSCLVQANLGAVCGAFDMNAACSGFMFGLVTASQFIQSGQYRNILLICAEKMTMVVDPQDLKTFPLFGDGAAAVLISQVLEGDSPAPSGILAYALGSQGELGHTLMVPCGGSRYPATVERLADRSQFLKMEGRTVFKWAVRLIPDVIEHLLQDAQLRREDIDLFVFHQANRRIIDAATEAAGLDPNRVFVNVDRYGNTSAASIPICLHEAAAQGLIRPGSKIFMAGFGSGLTWGGCIFQW